MVLRMVSCFLSIQNRKHARLFIWLVDADGDHFEGAVTVHAIDRLEIRHFLLTWPVPHGPEVHQQKLAGWIFSLGL